MIDEEILKIANQASLQIMADNKTVNIKQIFRLGDKSIWGVLFFFCGGVFFMAAPFVKTSDTTSKTLGIVIGFLFLLLSIMTLIRQGVDSLKIADGEISFRYNLKYCSFRIDKRMKVKMETEIVKIRSVGTLGSDFILVTHYLLDSNSKIPILNYHMEKTNSEKAIKLGNEINQIINEKLQQSY